MKMIFSHKLSDVEIQLGTERISFQCPYELDELLNRPWPLCNGFAWVCSSKASCFIVRCVLCKIQLHASKQVHKKKKKKKKSDVMHNN